MGIDLKGKTPKANTLEEANKIIKALWDVIQQLSEKLKTSSKNSSLSPSKDRSSKNKSNAKRTEERKKNPKKRGAQPGHKKHDRALLPLNKVNHVVSCCPNSACACGGQVRLNSGYRRHQQYEFPVIRPIVTEYQIYSGSCNQCQQKQTGVLPKGASWGLLGPRATAMTANLSGTYRISKQNIVNLYQDIFDFNVSVGMICKAEKKRDFRIKIFVEGLLRQGQRSKNKKTAGTCKNILSYGPALWCFLKTDGIEPTNNLAERLIRTIAIWRKTSFGTQSKAGSLYMERIMTVVATCKLQRKNILDYLTDAVKSHIEKSDSPSLLPKNLNNNARLAIAA